MSGGIVFILICLYTLLGLSVSHLTEPLLNDEYWEDRVELSMFIVLLAGLLWPIFLIPIIIGLIYKRVDKWNQDRIKKKQ